MTTHFDLKTKLRISGVLPLFLSALAAGYKEPHLLIYTYAYKICKKNPTLRLDHENEKQEFDDCRGKSAVRDAYKVTGP